MFYSIKQSSRLWTFLVFAIFACLAALPAHAHVGSPDVYAEGNAGPYKLFVTVRPPLVIPGVAEIEVRADAAPSASGIEITPIPLTGEASKHPPVADVMKQSAQDKQFFTGTLWIMAPGSWQVRFLVHGSQGDGVLSIPLPATARGTLGMQTNLGIILAVLGAFLILGIVGIVGAAVQDAQLAPGTEASKAARMRAAVAMGVAFVIIAGMVVFGYIWWNNDAQQYSANVYKPLNMRAKLTADHRLKLNLADPGWLKARRLDDFVLDHNHLMHLYMIREPNLDVVFHLHPDQIAPGEFEMPLPSVLAGQYRLYADVVHANGFPETLVASLTLPAINGVPLTGDNSAGTVPPIALSSSSACVAPTGKPRFQFPDGYSMMWDNPEPQPAKTPELYQFSLFAPDGKPASDTGLYMDMLGHAAFVKTDGTVFAHVHPSGTVAMAALMMAEAQNQSPKQQQSKPGMDTSGMNMQGMDMSGIEHSGHQPNVVGFPYGFPTPGQYRIFVQMKHGQTVETAAFDACAKPAKVQ
ncbi:hypothetical protein ACFPT7_04350 [Acidicapsa dinghuensis]|uniref:Copper resistance protein CopC n=1 Tax=Acidicapsa dinghuensis TaxID=2218256 RepID=A0ABW1ECF2_9BACT|nr:hypothetical protein [Acidicapsa dinghuensis]